MELIVQPVSKDLAVEPYYALSAAALLRFNPRTPR